MEEGRYVHRIWRALDADPTFFGIRGRYLLLVVLGAVAAAVMAMAVWVPAGDTVGLLVLAAGLVADWLAVSALQHRMTVRQFSRYISARRLPRWARVKPGRVGDILKEEFTWK